MSTRLTVGTGRSLSANMGVFDRGVEGIVFASAFGYTTAVKQAEKDINRKNNSYFMSHYFTTESNAYDVHTARIPNTDYSHIIICKKDRIMGDEGHKSLSFFVLIDDPEFQEMSVNDLRFAEELPQQLQDIVFDKLYKMSPAPILKEWVSYLIRDMARNGNIRVLETYNQDEDKHKMTAYNVNVRIDWIINAISAGLRAGVISINGQNEASDKMKEVSGIDGYLNGFSETLTARIREAFVPRFVPGQDKYSKHLNLVCDYAAYHGHINLYEAQKAACQSVSNALDHKKAAFIVAEMGTGKTAMSITSVLTHAKGKRRQCIIVMCPGHLVYKWKAEIERLAPLSDTYIVEDFSDLLKVEKIVKNPLRMRHVWIIMSKEVAKFGYEERPAVVWNESKLSHFRKGAAHTCPCCGKPVFYETVEGKKKDKHVVKHNLLERDFAKKNAKNSVCLNKVRKWNPEKMDWELVPCGAKLWQAFSKDVDYGNGNGANEWIKTKAGWIEKTHIGSVFAELTGKMEANAMEKSDEEWLEALTLIMDEDEKQIVRAPRKYPIARYIHRYFKGCVDYFVADEIHELKGGDTAQGEAFGDIAFAAKKTIGLTGTLLNGYASGIYYILYRLFANEMKREGYDYDSPDAFAKEYGVMKTESSFDYEDGLQGRRRGSSRLKFLPGVSPLVFTKFLLENAAFISQEDIASGLPAYKEIPVPVEMDTRLKQEYMDLEHSFKSNKNPYDGGMRFMAQMVQTLSIYPDQPYDQPDVVDPVTGDTVMHPVSIDKDVVRNKEAKLVELTKQKVEAGEKVLVYYHWTNRTEVAARLKKQLEAEGLKVDLLTAKIKAKDREEWIKNKVAKGTQVLMCNPTLVQTGLDLLDFTTIIYYQMGYNLFTMRQASRRSWRLGQEHDIEVYFMFYKDTVQEKALSLMASKLQASMAIEGKFSEEGLNAMSNNEDILTQIAASVTEGIKDTVETQVFEQTSVASRKSEAVKIGPTLAEKMLEHKHTHLDYKSKYLSSKARGKRLLTANRITNLIHKDPMILFRMA